MFGASVSGADERLELAPDRAAEQPEGRVHVPDPTSGEQRGGEPDGAREQEAVRRVVALDADAEHEVGLVALLPEPRELGDDELAVGVDLEDPVGAARA